jgi:pyridoxine/pyridoxamine 5'-phosphate oxidase
MENIEQHIFQLRKDYSSESLDEGVVFPDPLHQFKFWLEEAAKAFNSLPIMLAEKAMI